MYEQPTLWDTDNAISSPGLEFGASLFATPGGLTIAPSGPALAPASPSAEPGRAPDSTTSGISGPTSSASSRSAALTSALANRLRVRSASLGSTLCKLTWKERAMPSGRSIPALRASALPIGDKGSTGWPTPATRDYKDRFEQTAVETNALLGRVVWLSAWPTPQAHDVTGRSKTQKDLHKAKHGCACLARSSDLAGWPTPRALDGVKNVRTLAGSLREIERKGCVQDLAQAAAIAGPARLTAFGELRTGSSAETESGGQLRAEHSLWLQLGPNAAAWKAALERSVSKALETRSTSPKRRSS